MRKEYTILTVIFILAIAVGIYWYYPTGDDVRIVKLDAPDTLYLGDCGNLLNVTFRNNAITPVNISTNIENAIIDENGTSFTNINPDSPYGKFTLLPGDNTKNFLLGYLTPGTHNVRVKVYQNGRLIDKDHINVTVPMPYRPKLSLLPLAYRIETTDDHDVYRIYGYLLNDMRQSDSSDISVQISIINDKTGEIVLNNTDNYHIVPNRIEALSKWKGKPLAVIELAHNESSNETYVPVPNVVKGKVGDRYRVNVTALWSDPWLDMRSDQWYEEYGQSFEKKGYWYYYGFRSEKYYEPPQFDRIITIHDEFIIPSG